MAAREEDGGSPHPTAVPPAPPQFTAAMESKRGEEGGSSSSLPSTPNAATMAAAREEDGGSPHPLDEAAEFLVQNALGVSVGEFLYGDPPPPPMIVMVDIDFKMGWRKGDELDDEGKPVVARFKERISWEVPSMSSPLAFANEMAIFYHLNFDEMNNLAESIQSQIDAAKRASGRVFPGGETHVSGEGFARIGYDPHALSWATASDAVKSGEGETHALPGATASDAVKSGEGFDRSGVETHALPGATASDAVKSGEGFARSGGETRG